MVKNLPAMWEIWVSFLGTGRSPGEGNGNPFQYFCLENPMDRGSWWATVHGVTESDTTKQLTLSLRTSPKQAKFEWFYENRQDLLELTHTHTHTHTHDVLSS